jgi:hypothetical protein
MQRLSGYAVIFLTADDGLDASRITVLLLLLRLVIDMVRHDNIGELVIRGGR